MNSLNSCSSIVNTYNSYYVYSYPTTVSAKITSTNSNFNPVQLGGATGYHVYKFTSSGTIQFTSTPTKPITAILVGGGGGGGVVGLMVMDVEEVEAEELEMEL